MAASSLLDDNAPIQSGFLFKKGLFRTKQWKRRKFFFDSKEPEKLFYSRDVEKERKLFKVIKLPAAVGSAVWDTNTKSFDVTTVRSVNSEIFDDIPESVRGNGFTLNTVDSSGKAKKIFLYAESADEKRRWMATIERWKVQAEKKARETSSKGTGYSSTYIS